MIPFPDRRYAVIYADPPWSYRDKANAGKRGAIHKYGTMECGDISSLPVRDIAADNCALFLWCTMPQLDIGLKVLTAWGFAYKTAAFTWVKKTVNNKMFWGMGNWTRANAEICLLGTTGKPRRESAGVHSVIESIVGKHSEKPVEARDRIVKLCGDVPRVELFARQRVDGWDSWGDEI